MNKVKFFLDTADVQYCQRIWNNFSKSLSGKELVGITTNPNALSKINVRTIKEMRKTVYDLCCFVTSVRQDNQGVIYVQIPLSTMPQNEIVKYINLIKSFSDSHTKIGIKIPPYSGCLELVEQYKHDIDFNVTGIAECSTALKCLTYNVRYVSIIPGRMKERGIDTNEQLNFITKRKNTLSEVIAGSMRTIEGLQQAVVNSTVPTIGWRVLDKIVESDRLEEVINFWNEPKLDLHYNFSPEINQEMTKLSIEFFQQMDNLGVFLYDDFKNLIK